MDFTESFNIAAFFAMESATEDSCVWGINSKWVILETLERGKIEINSEIAYPANVEPVLRYAESFIESGRAYEYLIIKVAPPRLNERLAVQRGLFMFPCNIFTTFEGNLCSTFEFPIDTLEGNATQIRSEDINRDFALSTWVIKIHIPRKWHRDAIYDLHSMNIDSTSLFLGLDGFAKSLKILMRQTDITKDS